MKKTTGVLAGLVCMLLALGTEAAEQVLTPHLIISQLRVRITNIGESTRQQGDYDIATQEAVNALQDFIAKGDNLEQLNHKDKWGKTPLNLAAYLGYPKIVAELLAQPSVKISINEPDDHGITPWTYAVFAPRQSAFACNPKIFNSPFSWAPMHLSIPFYTQRNAYQQTRQLLEQAGATTDMTQAKRHWNDICKFQSQDVQDAINSTDDLQRTAIEQGAVALQAFMDKIQRR